MRLNKKQKHHPSEKLKKEKKKKIPDPDFHAPWKSNGAPLEQLCNIPHMEVLQIVSFAGKNIFVQSVNFREILTKRS